jgi:hypothetical protein
MKLIGAWLNTDGNLIDIYGMHDKFSERYLLNNDDIIWNGRNDFKYLKPKITNHKRETSIGINRSKDLINFEIILDGITQYMNLHQFLTIRAFKKLIMK